MDAHSHSSELNSVYKFLTGTVCLYIILYEQLNSQWTLIAFLPTESKCKRLLYCSCRFTNAQEEFILFLYVVHTHTIADADSLIRPIAVSPGLQETHYPRNEVLYEVSKKEKTVSTLSHW